MLPMSSTFQSPPSATIARAATRPDWTSSSTPTVGSAQDGPRATSTGLESTASADTPHPRNRNGSGRPLAGATPGVDARPGIRRVAGPPAARAWLAIAGVVPALLPLGLVARLPVVRSLVEPTYGLIARNRHRISRLLGDGECALGPRRT